MISADPPPSARFSPMAALGRFALGFATVVPSTVWPGLRTPSRALNFYDLPLWGGSWYTGGRSARMQDPTSNPPDCWLRTESGRCLDRLGALWAIGESSAASTTSAKIWRQSSEPGLIKMS
ncbi:uncharacterized protein N7459_004899 [Penicillium hispanicum]|uniref:uncharacterized protein n=1 Tax=Penicillium hispanicum TaxID=1080232 RepID=UPI00254088E8|nr:uncharacterized protein N7459_004899 [Penicillium hispanicum]KAJ5585099.1 hypothetical protein N7459_004899 [Penicillium hispanicum]